MQLGKHKVFRQLQIKRADAKHCAAWYYYRIKKPLKSIQAIEARLKLLQDDYALIEQKRKWNQHLYFEHEFRLLSATKHARIAALELESATLTESIKEELSFVEHP